MTPPSFSPGQPAERAFARDVLFALELLDAVTLMRVSNGLSVVADGLRRTPIVNAGGLFVWLREDPAGLRRISIDPGPLPYEAVDLTPAQLGAPPAPRPLTTIQLPPSPAYPFPSGVTAARGTLVEDRLETPARPIARAEVGLRWLDEDGVTWRSPAVTSHTSAAGDFACVLRLARDDVPKLDASGAITARLHARREAGAERTSVDLKLPQGRVADPATLSALIVAWDEMLP